MSALQTYLVNKIINNFPAWPIKENYRPEWMLSSNLTRLELDVYIPKLQIAVEVQGAQHFIYIPHFHQSIEAYQKRLLYDQEKRDLCRGQGIELYEVCTYIDADIFINGIKQNLRPKQPIEQKDVNIYRAASQLQNQARRSIIQNMPHDCIQKRIARLFVHHTKNHIPFGHNFLPKEIIIYYEAHKTNIDKRIKALYH